MLSINRRDVDYLAANKQIITRPILQDEFSFLRLPELKSVTGLSKSRLYALIRAKSVLRRFNSDRKICLMD